MTTTERQKLKNALQGIVLKYGPQEVMDIITLLRYKKCPRCQRVLTFDSFGKRRGNELKSYCFDCDRSYQQELRDKKRSEKNARFRITKRN